MSLGATRGSLILSLLFHEEDFSGKGVLLSYPGDGFSSIIRGSESEDDGAPGLRDADTPR